MKSSTKAGKTMLALLSLFLCLTLFAIPTTAASKKTYENGALTPPPPIEDSYTRYTPVTSGGAGISVNSAWDSSHIYLSSGDVGIAVKDGVVIGDGGTDATQYVDEIGVQLTFQRWTGSSWTDIYTTVKHKEYDTPEAYYKESRSVTKGYYYRIKSYHWVSHEGTYESGWGSSNYRLVK